MILIKNIDVYSPTKLGIKDVLISGTKIHKISSCINMDTSFCKIIDGTKKKLVPGFIDSHVHICGGGGEGGFETRTPEIMLSQIITSGITTVIGVLGTDGTTRTMTNLIAKTKGLKKEGISAYCLTGSYEIPTRSLMGSITDDIILIEEIIGAGELAISDHRSSHPSLNELRHIFSETRRGGILAGKSGIINLHLGDDKKGLTPLKNILESTSLPIKQFLPTHMNRNPYLFKEGIEFIKKGGYIDLTTSTVPEFLISGEIECGTALKEILKEIGNIDQVTFSSDGQGSLPQYDDQGNMIRLKIGSCDSLYSTIKNAIEVFKIPLETAIKAITSNVEDLYKLNKGYIEEGRDADLVILDEKNDIETVIALGKMFLENKKIIIKGTFE